MAGTNEILTFAQGGAANIVPQTDWAALSARLNGFQSGVAQSNQVNKALRQVAFMARVLSQWAIDNTGGSILDNGDEANAKSLLTLCVQAITNAILLANNYATNPQLSSAVASLTNAINNEAVLRAQADQAENAFRTTADNFEAKARSDGLVAESNTRYAQDQAIIALLAGKMQTHSTRSGFGHVVSGPAVSSEVRLDIDFVSSGPAAYFLFGAANVSSGVQPSGGLLRLIFQGVGEITEGTSGPMALSLTTQLAETSATAHQITLIYTPQTPGAVLSQVGLNLSYIAVQY